VYWQPDGYPSAEIGRHRRKATLAGRRISGTCSLMGQAVGTAAALCVKKGVLPRNIAQHHVDDLQEQLLRDDAFIPWQRTKHV